MFIRIWHKKIDRLSVQCRMYVSPTKGTCMDKITTFLIPVPSWEDFKGTLTGPVEFLDDL